jgi:lauroyl/myristoyl acyltransferase
VATTAAVAIAPIIRVTGAKRFRRSPHTETPMEAALQMVLRTLDRVGTEYDPVVIVHGAEPFGATREAGRGLLMVGPHAQLSKLVVRYLYDHGYSPILLSSAPMRVGGLPRPPRQIVTSPTSLLRVRTALRAGSILFGMADHDGEISHRVKSVPTMAGPVFLSDGLIRIAHRCGAAILFFASALSDDGVVHIYLEPPSSASQSVEAIANDFAAFVQSHVHRVQRAIGADDDERCTTDHRSLPNTSV